MQVEKGSKVTKGKIRVLFVYSPHAAHVNTTYQYITAFRRHSRYKIEYLSCLSDGVFDFSDYDAVWLNYCARLIVPGAVKPAIKSAIARFSGPTFVALQDEYDLTELCRRELLGIGATHVMTCVPTKSIEYVYPKAMFPTTVFETVLTGYVPDELGAASAGAPLAARSIHLGYRGRSLSWRYGMLATQKIGIGLEALKACQQRGIPCDIAVDEASRIYGAAWFDFMRSCRATLGSESGSNVFDFDGSISARFSPSAPQPDEVPELVSLIAQRESEIAMGQISPRVFEAAALGSALVLMRGHYSGAIEPEEHYLPVEHDYSNLGSVVERLADVDALQAMADRAREHLIGSGQFSYQAFIARVDALIGSAVDDKPPSTAEHIGRTDTNPLPVTDRPYGNDPLVIELMRNIQTLYGSLDQAMGERNHYARELDALAHKFNALSNERDEKVALVARQAEELAELNERTSTKILRFLRDRLGLQFR